MSSMTILDVKQILRKLLALGDAEIRLIRGARYLSDPDNLNELEIKKDPSINMLLITKT
jgi:hypothetical protein